LWTSPSVGSVCHVAIHSPQSVQQFRLHPRLQNHQVHVNLFAVLELPENPVVVLFRDAFRITTGALDERLQRPLQEMVDLAVVVVVVADPQQALDVIPDGPAKPRRVHVRATAHRVVRQVLCGLELVVQQIPHVVVQPIDQRVSVVVPRVVLHPERGEVELFVPLGEILIAELAVLDETTDIRGSFQTFGPHQAQFSALRLDTFETFRQLHGGALLVLLRERLHPLHDRVYSYLGFGGRRRTNVRGVFPVFGYIDSWYIFGITLIRIAGMSRASGLSGHLVLVSAGLIHFLIDTTSEHKRTKRMKMSQYDYSVYNFGQRPAIFSFSQFLNMRRI
jgi:hypothetical protein